MQTQRPTPPTSHEALKHFKDHGALVKIIVHATTELRLTIVGGAPCVALFLLASKFDVKAAWAALCHLARGG
jgi:hypothetical protein